MKLLIILTTLCFALNVRVLVQGLYLVQVRLNGYSNPTGKCGDNQHCCTTSSQCRCCDSPGTINCGQFCDSYFIYCLRPLGERRPVDSPRCFSNETRAKSSPNRDDNRSLDFSQSTVLDLDNPQNLSGLGDAYQGVQIYIEVWDQDFNDDDLIDLILINHNLTIARSLQQNHTGIYTVVTMNLTITVFCERNFRGSGCTECVPGLTGANCNMTDNCFGMNCSGNGKCWNTPSNDSIDLFICVCDSGFRGPLCNEVDRLSGNSISTGSNVGAIAGGVIGALLFVAILLILLMVVWVISLKCRNNDASNQDLDMRENEAYAVSSELQESFEMSTSICYATTEPRNLYTTDNISYGCLSVSGKQNIHTVS